MGQLGIRFKLITIFVLIKVVPLIFLAWIAWNGISMLGETLQNKVSELSADTQTVIDQVGDLAVDSSIRALDIKSRENIERLTTDTARRVAQFLYGRDSDILQAAGLEISDKTYRNYLVPLKRTVIDHRPWVLNEAGDAWVPEFPLETETTVRLASNKANSKDFHYRPPEDPGIPVKRPLYLEMTFIDLDGNERVKVTTSDILSSKKRNISDSANTYCKAEHYYEQLKALKPGEVYVSEVIGPYVPSPIIGPYTKTRAEKLGVPFHPEEAAYAGKENPVGKRFQGLVRWATPVVRKGKVVGWVSLALDHTHIMEFTDHLVPTDERYSPISNAGSGNYAFIWDYKERNISHPRDYFIVGYDPETGEEAIPWLEADLYEQYKESGLSFAEWKKTVPDFFDQSLERKPAKELTQKGMLGLSCRYLNFAPQCEGWYNLTKDGGSGSFVIFWSGLWKLTTAAAIPYHTGMYSGPRGFGFVTIGANVHEFHRAATETGQLISGMAKEYESRLAEKGKETQRNLDYYLNKTTREITLSTVVMAVLVILIAIWIASTLTSKITRMIRGIELFKGGDMQFRLPVDSSDEVGQLAEAFNEMSDDISHLVDDLRQAEEKYRSFFENSTEGIFRTTEDGRLVAGNPALARIFGYKDVPTMLSSITNLVQIYVDPRKRREFISVLQDQKTVHGFQSELRRADGAIRQMSTSARWMVENDGSAYIEGVVADVTEQRQAVEALRMAKEEAEQLSAIKSSFLSMVSHELRTPLTSIVGFAKITRKNISRILGSDKTFPEIESRLLNRIDSNSAVIASEGDRLTELINNVLDLAKLEAGRFEWHFGVVEIGKVVQQSIVAMAPLFEERSTKLTVDIADGLPVLSGDHDRLVQVCINLLSNAVKFAPGGKVHCTVSTDDAKVTLSFMDNGMGVPPDERETVFDKFRQLGDTLTDKPKGTGLGLPICKEIVEFHGGEIWCEGATGGGSLFIVTLPRYCLWDAENRKPM